MKQKTKTKLKKKLWKLFSKYVRERDNYVCITCGGNGNQAGHFITGATCPPSLYFDKRNVHAQCYRCNINLSGNWVIYEQRLTGKYGKKVVDELKAKRTNLMGEVWNIQDYELEIQKYD